MTIGRRTLAYIGRCGKKEMNTCGTCRWYNKFEGICANIDSERRAGFVERDRVCGKWEAVEYEMPSGQIIAFLRQGVMAREEAIRILDPETALEARVEYEYYGGFSGEAVYEKAFQAATLMAVSALRAQQGRP